MKLPLSIFIFITLNCQNGYSQSDIKKLTIISYDYTGTNVRVDSSIYTLATRAWPQYEIRLWRDLGCSGLPVLYSKFVIDRKPPLLSRDTSLNEIITKSFNELKNEWFIYEKRKKIAKKKVVLWQTFYHEFHQTYFTTKTIMTFNKNGYLKQIKTFDKNRRKLVEKKVYLYN